MYDYLVKIVTASWCVLAEMSPYLLFGFLLAGILSLCISADWVKRHLGGKGVWPVVKASLFGIPLPLCSCGVLPVSASIRRHGASKAATTSFLLSTPQTGVDSIAVTYAMLGPVFAIFRPIAALVTGLMGGWLVQLFGDSKKQTAKAKPEHSTVKECQDECCTSKASAAGLLIQGLKHGFVTLPSDIGWPLLLGVVIAGAIGVVVPEKSLAAYLGGGIASILVMMIVGVPIYVCATASIPIAAGFMHMGASPGAALAFLIAGPVTNAATLLTIWRILGHRVAIIYLATVAIGAVICGLTLDWLIATLEMPGPSLASAHHEHINCSWFSIFSAIILLAVLGYSSFNSITSKRATRQQAKATDDRLQTNETRLEFAVTGMTCEHCVGNVKNALEAIEGVISVDVQLSKAEAIVTADKNVTATEIINVIEEQGYSAKQLQRTL